MSGRHIPTRKAARPRRKVAAANLDDIQGNVLRPYDNDHGEFLMVEVRDAQAGRELLAELRPQLTDATPWVSPPDSTLNVAVTAAGLRALGVPDAFVDDLPEAFRDGSVARAARLGDIDAADPDTWDAGLRDDTGHLLLSITAWHLEHLEARAAAVVARIAADEGLHLAHRERAFRFADHKEHFGFLDGVAQPKIAGIDRRGTPSMGTPLPGRWASLPLGEFILGHRDAEGVRATAPGNGWAHNGSFQVLRKLRQDVAAFRDLVNGPGEHYDPDLLAAKIIGRWPDGTPLALSPDRPDPAIAGDPARINDFRFSDDPAGLKCPAGAHIRRLNPRDGSGVGGSMTTRHRIVRRGLPYGPRLEAGAPDDGVDRGLMFVAFMADIDRQFEFLQHRWVNTGDVLGLGDDPDPLLGLPQPGAKFRVTGDKPYLLALDRPLVLTRGSAYLLQPSLRAIDDLAAGRAGA